jgi:hypothetical protein
MGSVGPGGGLVKISRVDRALPLDSRGAALCLLGSEFSDCHAARPACGTDFCPRSL